MRDRPNPRQAHTGAPFALDAVAGYTDILSPDGSTAPEGHGLPPTRE